MNGNLKKPITVSGGNANQTFEVGDATTYAPVTLDFPGTATVNGAMTVATTAGDHPNLATSTLDPTKSVNRYWSIANSGTGFTSYNPTVNFVAGDVDAGATPANFRIQRFAGGTWSTSTAGTRTASSTQATGLTGVGDLAVAEQAATNFTITASAGANGTISPAGSLTVASGGSQAFTVTPNAGHQVADVLRECAARRAVSA